MKTATLIAFNRPEYTREVLESLRKNNTKNYVLFVAIEPGCEQTIDICRSVDFMPIEILVNPSHRGVNYNNKYIYDLVFDRGSEWNVAIEDDTPLSPDAFDLVEWFFSFPKQDDYLLLNLFNGSRTVDRPLELFEHDAFCPWGYCFGKGAYERVIKPGWMCDQRGWDWSICKIMREKGLKSLSPFLSRARNIGKYGGVYCTPEFHDHCFSGHISSDGSFGKSFFIASDRRLVKI